MIYDICLYKKDSSGLLTALEPPYDEVTTKSGYIEQLLYIYLLTMPGSNETDPSFGSAFLSLCKQYYAANGLSETLAKELFLRALRDFIKWYYINVLSTLVTTEAASQLIGSVTVSISDSTMQVQFQLSGLDDTNISCKYSFDLSQ